MIEPSYALDLGSDTAAPKQGLSLASVRGVRSQGLTRGSLAYNRLGGLVYPAASTGVVYTRKTHRYQQPERVKLELTRAHLSLFDLSRYHKYSHHKSPPSSYLSQTASGIFEDTRGSKLLPFALVQTDGSWHQAKRVQDRSYVCGTQPQALR